MNQIDYRLESKLGPVRVRRETVLRQTEVACVVVVPTMRSFGARVSERVVLRVPRRKWRKIRLDCFFFSFWKFDDVGGL